MNTNDRSNAAPRLVSYLNLDTLADLPEWSAAPRGAEADIAAAIRAAGYEGVQGRNVAHWRGYGLTVSTLGRVNEPHEIAPLAAEWKRDGYDCATLHVGWGFEDDDTVDRLIGSILEASARESFPLYVETHRATVAQDPWRTLRLVERSPEVRFNADFSHWYTGLELVYGDIEHKFDLIEPVFERVRYMHARVGNAGHIQVPLSDPTMETAIVQYREMWARAMSCFLSDAHPREYLVFAPELLQSSINYARLYRDSDGVWREDSDRWTESLALVEIARECFAEAERRAR
jgi:hypothetical protein